MDPVQVGVLRVNLERIGGDIESFCGGFKDQGAPTGRVGWRCARCATIPGETIAEFRGEDKVVAKTRENYRADVMECDLGVR